MPELNRSPCRLNESAPTKTSDPRLLETATLSFERMTEASEQPGQLRVRGVAGQANIVNANGRYYPLEVVKAAVEEAQARITEGQMLMLEEHPTWDEPDTGELDDVAARITSLKVDETGVISYEAVLVNNECGRNIAALLEAGVKVQASTRATGTGVYVPAGELQVPGLDAAAEIYKVTQMLYLGVDFTLNPSVSTTHTDLTESQQTPPPTPKENVMDLDTLKKDHPALYEQIIASGRLMAESQQQNASVEAELARLKAENDQLKQASLNSVRSGIVTRALSEANLPKLGNAGNINLDERFERQVESAALSAASDAAAKEAVDLLITERRAILGQNTSIKVNEGINRAGLPAGNTEKALNEAKHDDKNAMNGILSARAQLGL